MSLSPVPVDCRLDDNMPLFGAVPVNGALCLLGNC